MQLPGILMLPQQTGGMPLQPAAPAQMPPQQPYPVNQTPPPMPAGNPAAPKPGKFSLQNPEFAQFLMGLGSAISAGRGGFGRAVMGMQAQAAERQQKAAEEQKAAQLSNMTARYLASQGAPAEIVQMAEAGYGQNALDLWKQSRPETPKPYSPQSSVGKITADYQAGMIDQETYQALLEKERARNNGITIGPDGTVQIGGKATEGQSKANIFATRAEKANALLDRLQAEGTSLGNRAASNVPVIGNYMLSPEYRQYDQAKRDFVNAILRQESGAVISDQEFANAEQQYFPQPGDDPQTIEQKRQNRITAMQTIREASGPFAVKGQTQSGGMPDLSTMTDDELRAIINGQ